MEHKKYGWFIYSYGCSLRMSKKTCIPPTMDQEPELRIQWIIRISISIIINQRAKKWERFQQDFWAKK